jgi:hypothetical protein
VRRSLPSRSCAEARGGGRGGGPAAGERPSWPAPRSGGASGTNKGRPAGAGRPQPAGDLASPRSPWHLRALRNPSTRRDERGGHPARVITGVSAARQRPLDAGQQHRRAPAAPRNLWPPAGSSGAPRVGAPARPAPHLTARAAAPLNAPATPAAPPHAAPPARAAGAHRPAAVPRDCAQHPGARGGGRAGGPGPPGGQGRRTPRLAAAQRRQPRQWAAPPQVGCVSAPSPRARAPGPSRSSGSRRRPLQAPRSTPPNRRCAPRCRRGSTSRGSHPTAVTWCASRVTPASSCSLSGWARRRTAAAVAAAALGHARARPSRRSRMAPRRACRRRVARTQQGARAVPWGRPGSSNGWWT